MPSITGEIGTVTIDSTTTVGKLVETKTEPTETTVEVVQPPKDIDTTKTTTTGEMVDTKTS